MNEHIDNQIVPYSGVGTQQTDQNNAFPCCGMEYISNEIWIYSEPGWMAEVSILTIKEDHETITYCLKVLKTISSSPCTEHLPPKGAIFDCQKLKHGLCSWSLKKKQEI